MLPWLSIKKPQQKAASILNRKTSCVKLEYCDAKYIQPTQNLYLPELGMLGRVHGVDDKNDSDGIGIPLSSCIVEVLGMVNPFTTTETTPSLIPEDINDLKRAWSELDDSDRTNWLSSREGYDTHVNLLKPSFVPHDFASDSSDIENISLLELLYDRNSFYEKIEQSTVTTSAFRLIPGGPGCGKTEKILSMISGCHGRMVLVAHANSLEVDLSERMQLVKYDGAFKKLRIIFLAHR